MENVAFRRFRTLVLASKPEDVGVYEKAFEETPAFIGKETQGTETTANIEIGDLQVSDDPKALVPLVQLAAQSEAPISLVFLDYRSDTRAAERLIKQLRRISPQPAVVVVAEFEGLSKIDRNLRLRHGEHLQFIKKPFVAHEIKQLIASLFLLWGQGELRSDSQTEKQRWGSKATTAMVLDKVPSCLYWKDRDSVLRGCNEAFLRFLGLPSSEAVIGKTEYDLPWPKAVADFFFEGGRNVMARKASRSRTVTAISISEHDQILLDHAKVALCDNTGSVIGILTSFDKVGTTDKGLKEGDGLHDNVTGLSNRELLMARIKHSIARAIRDKNHLFGVLVLNIDRFSTINDSLGHPAGDELLKQIGSRLLSCLRPTDMIARLQADEYALLLDEIRDVSDANRVAGRIQENLKDPFEINGRSIVLTASIGIALSVLGYDKPEELIRDANTAVLRAKRQGVSRVEMFEKKLQIQATKRLQLEHDLRLALDREEFINYYQPIVSLRDGRLVGFEALVRWRHPERGLIFPDEFISVSEETGMVVGLGEIVLKQACRQMSAWDKLVKPEDPLTISVNLSSKQFTDPKLLEKVVKTLRDTDFDPNRLKLEITESVIMENVGSVKAMFQELKDLKVQLLIDDFGTGYSSLSYLHRFPLDILKVDRSFVSNMHMGHENVEIVRTIVTLAHTLKMQVIAEGIETREQWLQLKELGCEYGQGYHFSKPVTPEDAEAFIHAGHIV